MCVVVYDIVLVREPNALNVKCWSFLCYGLLCSEKLFRPYCQLKMF